MSERALDRRLFDAAVNAYRVVPSTLRAVRFQLPEVGEVGSPHLPKDSTREVSTIEVTVRLVVPQILVDPSLIDELRRSGR